MRIILLQPMIFFSKKKNSLIRKGQTVKDNVCGNEWVSGKE